MALRDAEPLAVHDKDISVSVEQGAVKPHSKSRTSIY